MLKVLFWMLYSFGGAMFIIFMVLANRNGNKSEHTPFSFDVAKSFRIVVFGEFLWILLWMGGLFFDNSLLSILMGVIPLAMPIITFGSIFVLKIQEYIRDLNIKTKRSIKSGVRKWERTLPKDVKVKSVYFATISKHRGIATGRIVVELKSTEQNENINWHEYGSSLKGYIEGIFILKIKFNDETVFP